MDSATFIIKSAVDFSWSLWSEMGVPGVVRRHSMISVDPEQLIMHSPLIAASDPRLLELIYSWCATHHDRVSSSRLQGLFNVAPALVTCPFSTMASTLHLHRSVRWPFPERTGAWSEPPLIRKVNLQLSRPALLPLRLRAIFGVGARADVLGVLLSERDGWLSAADFEDLGYTKRNIARILSELLQAQLVDGRFQGNSRRFRLTHAKELSSIVGRDSVIQPIWSQIFALVTAAFELITFKDRSSALRRVEAHKSHEAVKQIAVHLRLPPPPETQANPDAWEGMMDWLSVQISSLASGSSFALSQR